MYLGRAEYCSAPRKIFIDGMCYSYESSIPDYFCKKLKYFIYSSKIHHDLIFADISKKKFNGCLMSNILAMNFENSILK